MELLNRAFGDTAIVVINERESPRPARVAIGRDDDLQWIANRAEVLPDIYLGRAVREIADE
jgi:hypothetical protein